jgi:hypothetical protein
MCVIWLQALGSKAPARGFYEKHGYGIEDYISLGKVLRT